MDRYCMDLTLSRWAVIQYSSHIWKRPEMKEHLLKLIKQSELDKNHIIPAELHDELDKLFLPPSIKKEVKFAVGSMGCMLKDCLPLLASTTDDHRTNIDYIDYVHWNLLGGIDYVQTTTSMYKSRILPITFVTWQQLCSYCIEECIIDFWEKISGSDEHEELLRYICSPKSFNYRKPLIAYWRLRMQQKLSEFKNIVERYDESITVDEYMFYISHSHKESFRYFVNRLDDDQKKSIMTRRVADYQIYGRNWLIPELYCLDKSLHYRLDCLLFQIKQYSNCGFGEVILEMLYSCDILNTMVVCWPYQDHFISVLEGACASNDLWPIKITVHIFDLMQLQKAFNGDCSTARKLFYYLWDNADNCKITEHSIQLAVNYICSHKDVELLEYIVNHPNMLQEKGKILEAILDHDEICSQLEEKEWFQSMLAQEEIGVLCT